jgi:hypothetical protein
LARGLGFLFWPSAAKDHNDWVHQASDIKTINAHLIMSSLRIACRLSLQESCAPNITPTKGKKAAVQIVTPPDGLRKILCRPFERKEWLSWIPKFNRASKQTTTNTTANTTTTIMKTAPSEIFFSCSESPTRVNLTPASLEQQLAASSSGAVSLSKNFGAREEWIVIPSNDDGNDDGDTVLIKSAKHGFYLSCTQDTKTILTSKSIDLAMHWSVLVSTEGGDEASEQFVSSSTDPECKAFYKHKLGHAEDGMLTAHPDAMLSS